MRAKEFIIETAMMGKIADSGKIIRILKKAHTVPFSDEKNWLLVDTDPGKGNSGLGIKWISADTRFEWVRPYKDSVDENLSPQTIHKLADHKGVKWDNEPSFLQLTKRLTGKEHLDDLDQAGLNKVKKHLDGLQGVAEEINSDVFNPAFNDTQIFDELTYRATAEEVNDKTYFQVKVLDSNFQQVGLAKFSPTKRGLVSAMTWVHPEYQGQGLARNIYAYVRSLGNTIAPSRNQLPPGKAMWASWKKSGDAKYLMNDVAESRDNEAEAYRAHLIKTLPQIIKLFANIGKGWIPSKEQMLSAVDTAYTVMKHTGDAKQAGKVLMDELNALYRMSQGQQGVAEGRDPDKKYTIKKSYTMSTAGVEKSVWYIMDGDFVVDATDLRRDAKYYADKWNAAEKDSKNA